MANVEEKLRKQFLPENRYDVFGPVLIGLDVRGMKGTNCKITFDYPVTAISGFNGAGKSTLAQIALCVYRAAEGDEATERKYLKDFFMKTLLDNDTYMDDAEISIRYAKESAFEQTVLYDDDDDQYDIVMTHATNRWAGYKHQPQKKVYYYGMSYFIPYQEQNSNLLKDSNANIKRTVKIKKEIVKKVAEILSIEYTSLFENDVENDKRTTNVISASKAAATYSENHMGCGEGRLLKLINALENAPDKSLFVIEEPETALHQQAQYKLAKYFLDVCERKKHQIIFTTHSPEVQRALPPNARKYIQRESDGHTSVVNSPSIAQIKSYLSGGHDRRMVVVAEDEVGKCYIAEILRLYGTDVFASCELFAMNLSHKEIKDYVRKSQNCGMNVFGIVDENKYADVPENVLAFPENTPPEISFFEDAEIVKTIQEEFSFDMAALPDDHHNYFNYIADINRESPEYVQKRCIKAYVKNKGQVYFAPIVEQFRQWLSACDN